jgi:methionyl aminopeptidase
MVAKREEPMSIDNEKDLHALLRIGRIVALAIREMQAHVQPGVTTGQLDQIGGAALARYGARGAPRLVYNFPGVNCISVNDEAAHGIPGERVIQECDLVKIDVTGELNGYYADACVTVPVPPVPAERQWLTDCAKEALDAALATARAGVPITRIGQAAEAVARRCGLNIVRDLFGHGVGRSIHESPLVPNFATSYEGEPLTEGLVLAIEPHVTSGTGRVVTAADGWTIRTADRRPVANYEHTVVVMQGAPLVVTAA